MFQISLQPLAAGGMPLPLATLPADVYLASTP
jgi:hypothetical protein